jgi:hypothetical protein
VDAPGRKGRVRLGHGERADLNGAEGERRLVLVVVDEVAARRTDLHADLLGHLGDPAHAGGQLELDEVGVDRELRGLDHADGLAVTD